VFSLKNGIGRELEALRPTTSSFWHERLRHDPANRWLRRVFVELFAE